MTTIKLTPKVDQDTKVTMEIEMTLEEWKKLKEQLEDKWPSWQFGSALFKALNEVEKHFETEVEVTN